MWTYIPKDVVPKYLEEYKSLSKFFQSLILLETQDSYFLPKLIFYSYPSQYLMLYNGQKDISPETIKIRFNGELRPVQNDAVKEVIKLYNQNGYVNGILKLYPSAGKTIIAIFLAYKLGLKTCIIVNRKKLIKQWTERILQFTNLTVDDIGIIHRDVCVTNKPIVIAIVQTLQSKAKANFSNFFKKIDNSRFGLVVYDEVHSILASEGTARTSVLFRTKNVLGLSATPIKSGIADILMKNTVGDIIFESKDYDIVPQYWFVYFNSKITKEQTEKLSKKGKPIYIGQVFRYLNDTIKQMAFYSKHIIKSQIYVNMIAEFSINMATHGHTVMCIGMYTSQILAISKRLDELGIAHRRYHGKEEELDYENDRIVLTNSNYCGEAFDWKKLSVVIFLTPFRGGKSIFQIVGRSLRTDKGKLVPVVIDPVDIDVPTLSLNSIQSKKKIIREEFGNCEILEYNHNV